MNFTIDLNTIIILTGLAVNLYFVVDRARALENRLTKLESWMTFVSEHFLSSKDVCEVLHGQKKS